MQMHEAKRWRVKSGSSLRMRYIRSWKEVIDLRTLSMAIVFLDSLDATLRSRVLAGRNINMRDRVPRLLLEQRLGLPPDNSSRISTDHATLCSFAGSGSFKPNRCRSLIIAAAFSGTICSQPGSPDRIWSRTSWEKISMIEASYPTIGAM
jgi:hypothetical protein